MWHWTDYCEIYESDVKKKEIQEVTKWMEKDYTKALQALTLNRTVNDFDKAKAVLDDLMEVNQDYWTLEKRD